MQAQQRCFGAVARWLGRTVGLPFVAVSPAAAKLAATGDTRATKAAVRAALTILCSGRPAEQGGRLPRGWTKAVVDALSCACSADTQLRLGLTGQRHGLEPVMRDQSLVPGESRGRTPSTPRAGRGSAVPEARRRSGISVRDRG